MSLAACARTVAMQVRVNALEPRHVARLVELCSLAAHLRCPIVGPALILCGTWHQDRSADLTQLADHLDVVVLEFTGIPSPSTILDHIDEESVWRDLGGLR